MNIYVTEISMADFRYRVYIYGMQWGTMVEMEGLNSPDVEPGN